MKKLTFAALCAMSLCASAEFVRPKGETVNLWPEGKTPSVSTNQTYAPFLEFFRPEKPVTDAFLIVAPGGGYGGVAYEGEGYPVHDFCMAKGMNMAILRYRTPRPIGMPMYFTAWQDVQRAVRVVRSQAEARGYSPDKIGVMGFSAGGHLTLMAATSSLTPAYEPVDELDKTSCSPNWAVPVYPAYVLTNTDHGGNDLEKCLLAPEFKFDAATPRMCLLHGDQDGFPAMGSIRVYHKLREMGVPAEIHSYAYMDHVFFRYAHEEDPGKRWLDTMWSWLYVTGIRTIHPNTHEKGWKRIIFGPIEKIGDFEKGTWWRDPQDTLTAYKDTPFWLKDEYENFVADFEFKLDPGANSGVIIYCTDKGNWIPNSVEIQLLDDYADKWKKDPPRLKCASIYGHIGPKVQNVKPAGEWNRMTIWAQGQHLRVAQNDELVLDVNLADWKSAKTNPDGSGIPPWLSKPMAELPTRGFIGFQGKHGGAQPYIRNLRIKEL